MGLTRRATCSLHVSSLHPRVFFFSFLFRIASSSSPSLPPLARKNGTEHQPLLRQALAAGEAKVCATRSLYLPPLVVVFLLSRGVFSLLARAHRWMA